MTLTNQSQHPNMIFTQYQNHFVYISNWKGCILNKIVQYNSTFDIVAYFQWC